MPVFPRIALFYRGFERFLVMGVQKHQKNALQTSLCRKAEGFNKKVKGLFSRCCFITFSGVSR
jgi:hypothetical protein